MAECPNRIYLRKSPIPWLYRWINNVRTQRKSYATEQRNIWGTRKTGERHVDWLRGEFEKIPRKEQTNFTIARKQLEQARLVRNFEIQQTSTGELIKQLELIKLQEIKDTPVVNVCEYAKETGAENRASRVYYHLYTFSSFIISSGWILSRDKIRQGWMQMRAGSKAQGDSWCNICLDQ